MLSWYYGVTKRPNVCQENITNSIYLELLMQSTMNLICAFMLFMVNSDPTISLLRIIILNLHIVAIRA